jgi:hypothetical protein
MLHLVTVNRRPIVAELATEPAAELLAALRQTAPEYRTRSSGSSVVEGSDE